MSIINVSKPCDTCIVSIKPTDWFSFCTYHLIREHIECAWSSLSDSKHKKCKKIDKNYPASILGEKKKDRKAYKSHFKEIIIKEKKEND